MMLTRFSERIFNPMRYTGFYGIENNMINIRKWNGDIFIVLQVEI